MKVLLRNLQTGLFYAGPDEWTQEQAAAQDFDGPDRALDHVSRTHLEAMEVVIQFEETSFEIPLTIISASA